LAAKVVFFSSDFVEASPETMGFWWNAKNGSYKVVFFSSGFVEASPETLGFLWNAENGRQGGLLLQWLCRGQPWNIGVFTVCGMLRMAAKVVFFSSGFVEVSPETLRFLILRMAAKVSSQWCFGGGYPWNSKGS
jgi:hypothetical protein